jgi:hypothetical protein
MSNEAHHHHDGRRVEDARLITGAGKYAADWNLPGQLDAVFVRSVVAVGSGLYVIVLALQSRAGYPIDSLSGRYGPRSSHCQR